MRKSKCAIFNNINGTDLHYRDKKRKIKKGFKKSLHKN